MLALALLPATALAQESDGVSSSGRLADEDFFRLVSCGAPPGGPCRGAVLTWPKRKLTVRLDLGDVAVPEGFEPRLLAAVTHAITQINGAGARVHLSFTPRKGADITIRATDVPEGTELEEIPHFSGSGTMGVGYMTVWSDDNDHITEAVILISTAITDQDLTSVMLEEVTQSLGLLYDIENPAYEGVSILSQTSNETTTIEGQDAALLRWLYPPKE